MKNLLILLFLLLLTFSSSNTVYAESHGSAIIPPMLIYSASDNNYSWIQVILSNITNEAVTCSFKVFGHDGEDITNTFLPAVYSGSYNDHGNSEPSSSFTIPANGSRRIQLQVKTLCSIIAHGRVEWSSDNEKMNKALVGTLQHRNFACGGTGTSLGFGIGYMPINNGMPF
ncbi:MAG: hypothetical protein MI799_10665 [Desulfobacterales bacterium]|nr:hypothetical protein [Desulfobacterales bacterium]